MENTANMLREDPILEAVHAQLYFDDHNDQSPAQQASLGAGIRLYVGRWNYDAILRVTKKITWRCCRRKL